ncbi:MAG TPA: electron transport complex subunit RsxG [Steroidobacteraceae bacterium]|nr:electron transport complex subunit RsxG [Steroidobacteraceae bacterium]
MAVPASEARPGRPWWTAAILLVVAVAAFGLVALIHEATREDIEAAAQARQVARFAEVLRGRDFDNDLLADTVDVRDPELLGTPASLRAHRARLRGEPVAVVLEAVAPHGYSGAIRLLVGIAPDGTVLGVRVAEHRETPGLGDAIEARKSDWIERFSGRSLRDPPLPRWRVRKDGGEFDQFTGATVTPRAVVGAVANALVYFERHRDELLAPPATIAGP